MASVGEACMHAIHRMGLSKRSVLHLLALAPAGLYRNRMNDVVKLLQTRHKGLYKVCLAANVGSSARIQLFSPA
jgi:hypothetical protein